MKVLHIIDSIGTGGAERSIKELIEFLNSEENNSSIEYHLYVLRKSTLEFRIDANNLVIDKCRSSFSFSSFFRLKKYISDSRTDILHCHLFKSKIFGWILKRFFFPNIKLVFHERGECYYKFYRILFGLLFKFTKTKFDKFLAVSSWAGDQISKLSGTERSLVESIVTPISVRQYLPIAEKVRTRRKMQKTASDSSLHVGFIGRLSWEKGCDIFIRALAKCPNDIQGIIAGTGSEYDKLQHLIIDLNLTDRVKLIGHCLDVPTLMGNLDALIVPSRSDACPRVILEAFACGTPVIGSSIEGINELISNKVNGLIFDISKPDDLANVILNLRNEALKLDLIERGFEKINDLDMRHYAQRLETIYYSICSK